MLLDGWLGLMGRIGRWEGSDGEREGQGEGSGV